MTPGCVASAARKFVTCGLTHGLAAAAGAAAGTAALTPSAVSAATARRRHGEHPPWPRRANGRAILRSIGIVHAQRERRGRKLEQEFVRMAPSVVRRDAALVARSSPQR